MEITEAQVIARYVSYCNDVRDAQYWFHNGRISQLGGKCPAVIFKEEGGPLRLCQWIFLLSKGLL